MKILSPLEEAGAQIHVPFFANTFPLAFHYWQMLLASKAKDWQKKIQLLEWGHEKNIIGAHRDEDGPPRVFYGTGEIHERLSPAERRRVSEIPLWTYRPKLIFAE